MRAIINLDMTGWNVDEITADGEIGLKIEDGLLILSTGDDILAVYERRHLVSIRLEPTDAEVDDKIERAVGGALTGRPGAHTPEQAEAMRKAFGNGATPVVMHMDVNPTRNDPAEAALAHRRAMREHS